MEEKQVKRKGGEEGDNNFVVNCVFYITTSTPLF